MAMLILFIILSILVNPSSAKTNYNVLSFGARGNGVTDSTQAFINAWATACASTEPTTIYVPKGRYLLGPVAFKGGCKSQISLYGLMERWWLRQIFVYWVKLRIGLALIKSPEFPLSEGHWMLKDLPCGFAKLKQELIVPMEPRQLYHIVINRCQDVLVEGIKVIASGNSPNTDGIHVQQSTNVKIINSSIKTGDDCISIGPATNNLWIEGVTCGPGHCISIGSLGKDMEEEGVQNVTVKNTVFKGTQNGLRIKSWARPSNGFVKGVQFIDVVMQNVQNPIIIDQNYCPHNLNCPSQVSGVKINDVLYQNIRGTSATPVAIKFECSTKYPCKGIKLQNVNLTYLKKVAQSSCANVIGTTMGLVKPDNCL
ncbi:hypothetical protein EZV62_000443 [Acer yangbiense]|uniref:Rhamnogalacturonase A/B/Epimerase-like pectate lyase domain-containing protein n=1 Tax=Acer yangbiense TaxID=1000413 RepID=A0A5C7ISP4_9ROSI|nr:hypothetical protein EZV62_000443 [Acer yangbiense]